VEELVEHVNTTIVAKTVEYILEIAMVVQELAVTKIMTPEVKELILQLCS